MLNWRNRDSAKHDQEVIESRHSSLNSAPPATVRHISGTQAWSAFSGLMLGFLSGQPLACVDVQKTLKRLGKAGCNASSLLSTSSSSKVGIV